MPTKQDLLHETKGLLAGIGFNVSKVADNVFAIFSKSGVTVAQGDLKTVYCCAVYMANEAKENPAKYEKMNASQETDKGELYKAGVEMAKRLKKG